MASTKRRNNCVFLVITIMVSAIGFCFVSFMISIEINSIKCANGNEELTQIMQLRHEINEYKQKLDNISTNNVNVNVNVNATNSNRWTYALIIVKCNDLLQALPLIHNIKTVDKKKNISIQITVFWIEGMNDNINDLINKMNNLNIKYLENVQFIKLNKFGLQPPMQFINPLHMNWFAVAWNKLSLWNETLFDTIIYLDNDILLKSSIHELFTLNLNSFTIHSQMEGNPSDGINAGIIVIKPNQQLVHYFVKYGRENNHWYIYMTSEQSFLNNAMQIYHKYIHNNMPPPYSININNNNNIYDNNMPPPYIMLSHIYNNIAAYCDNLLEMRFINKVKVWR
eukprot:114379_1